MTERSMLPQRRPSETFAIRHGGHNTPFYITVGYYPDGRVGEVFVAGGKAGSEVESIARDSAVLLSIAMQFGVPLETIRHAITREQNGSPSSIIGAVVERLVQP
jgi:ribonucleoside-diphosphate reductase alpha chain